MDVREWDSRFFGYPVASRSFDAAAPTASDLHRILREARNSGVRLLYLFLPPVDASCRFTLEQAGAKPVGRKCEYSKPVRMPEASEVGEGVVLCRRSSPGLEQLALQSGVQSRFRLDDGFRNGEFERLYREWLASSLRGENGKRVFVAGKMENPGGLVTVEPGEIARIGLLAVSADQRGTGLGRRLVAEAERFCCDHDRAELRVATQSENQEACRFYEACAFRKIAEVEIFHVWLPAKPAG